jgi:hypothetical protein
MRNSMQESAASEVMAVRLVAVAWAELVVVVRI